MLWNKWKKENSIVINSVEDILEVREQFKEDHRVEIYEATVTLCSFHHRIKLHGLYGKVPALTTAQKQKRWCDKQKAKH
jgi:hypothetical protein